MQALLCGVPLDEQADLLPHCQECPTADGVPSLLPLSGVCFEIVSSAVESLQFCGVLVLHINVLYAEGQLLANNTYIGIFT